MTLSSETNRVEYNGDGATVAFTVTFVFWDADDLRVIHVDSSGTETVWTRGTEYTVTGGDGATGTVTVSTSPTDYTPASGETLVIKSDLDDLQSTSLPSGGAFPSASVEEQMDKIVRLIQQKATDTAAAVLVPESESSIGRLPTVSTRASKFFAFDASGDPIASSGDAGSVTVSTFMETVLDDTTAAAARTTLGLAIGTDVLAPDGDGSSLSGVLLTGADGVAQITRKTSNETVNSTTTLQNDDDLAYALAANEKIRFECQIFFNSGTTPDFKAGFTVPSGATIVWNTPSGGNWGPTGTWAVIVNRTSSGDSVVVGGNASNDLCVIFAGTVINGANAGNLQLQWAQNTSDAGDTTVLANSTLTVWKFS